MILDKVNSPEVNDEGSSANANKRLGLQQLRRCYSIGRTTRGKIKLDEQVVVVDTDNNERKGKVLQVMGYNGLERIEVTEAQAGDIICNNWS